MTGSWTEKGGGAFFLSFDKNQWQLDTSLINGADAIDASVRMLDQSRIGAVLCGEPEALRGAWRRDEDPDGDGEERRVSYAHASV